MKRVANKLVRSCVEALEEFTNTNQTIQGAHRTLEDGTSVYVVTSYGDHWPMYVAIHRDGGWQWLHNSDPTPSSTTTRHMGFARPWLYNGGCRITYPQITPTPRNHLIYLLENGLTAYTAKLLSREPFPDYPYSLNR